ncbi:MAG: T9SS type A sorting domain-containing protein [Bacteroidia bacterium]|nr:T9SS type A sorting domain-containing protein [Bacteroidia bacterium]
MKRLILRAFIAVLFGQNLAIAQISNLTIIPSILTLSSNVQVIASTNGPMSSCNLITSSVSISGYTIDIYATHNMGMSPALCSSIDTITIGTLQPGAYCLLYHLTGQNPVHTYTLDVDTICFTVDQLSGLTNYSQTNKDFQIYPNPITSYFTINRLTDSYKNFDIEIFNLYGQKLTSIKQLDSKTPIDIASFPNGTYILMINDGDKILRTKIIKNTP